MSKYLDKNGVAHLWERIQELVATCGGGKEYESRTLELFQPNANGYLYAEKITINGHLGLTIDGTTTSLGTLVVGLTNKPSADAVAVAFQGIRSQYNGVPFENIVGMWYDSDSRQYNIHLKAPNGLTINQNDLSIDAIEFKVGQSHIDKSCVLIGDCQDDGDGGDIK